MILVSLGYKLLARLLWLIHKLERKLAIPEQCLHMNSIRSSKIEKRPQSSLERKLPSLDGLRVRQTDFGLPIGLKFEVSKRTRLLSLFVSDLANTGPNKATSTWRED